MLGALTDPRQRLAPPEKQIVVHTLSSGRRCYNNTIIVLSRRRYGAKMMISTIVTRVYNLKITLDFMSTTTQILRPPKRKGAC